MFMQLLTDILQKVLREWYTHIGCLPTRLQGSTRYINYSKGEGFKYTTPPSVKKKQETELEWHSFMRYVNSKIQWFIENGIPVEDATMCLPIAYSSNMVDKRNFRNVVDMTAQKRSCSRAYWEYRNELMKDYLGALREYSDEWKTLVDMTCKPKCEKLGYCEEKEVLWQETKEGEVIYEEDNFDFSCMYWDVFCFSWMKRISNK